MFNALRALVLQARRLKCGFEDVLGKFSEAEISLKEITKMVMKDTTKDDSELTGIYSRDFEYNLSAIFVDADTASVIFCVYYLI